MDKVVDKTVQMQMLGEDGNAFAIMGQFQREAKRQGWSQQEIDAVLEEAKSGDYNHLLYTIDNHIEDVGVEDEEY